MKFLIAPTLVLFATILGRRFGNTFGGWLIALPLTSAPAAYVISSKYGFAFSYKVIAGMMFATISQVVFALLYFQASRKYKPLTSLIAGVVGFGFSTLILNLIHLDIFLKFLLVVLAIIGGMKVFQKAKGIQISRVVPSPIWEIPVRVATATFVVFAITEISPHVGANLAGLLSPFPVLAAVMAFFTHLSEGKLEAQLVLKGLIMGLLTPASYFFVLGLTVNSQGYFAFLYALIVAICIQILSGKRITTQESQK